MKLPVVVAAFLAFAWPLAPALAQPWEAPVDRIFLNGRIWTGDEKQPWAEALAISGDRIAGVGRNSEIGGKAGPQTLLVDLQGRFVAPGFQDSHIHLPGPSLNAVLVDDLKTIEAFQAKLSGFAQTHPDVPWITGRGWGYALFPDNIAHRKYIDAVIPDRPVYLRGRDGHMGLANSAALKALGITSATPNPPNGLIVKDAAGEPTGEFRESADEFVREKIPAESADARYAALLASLDKAAAEGLTSAHVAGTSVETLALFERALNANALKLRLHVALDMIPGLGGYPPDHQLASPLSEADIAPYIALKDRLRGPLLTVASIKGMLDGSIDGKTAAMDAPYSGTDTRGIAFWRPADLNQTVALYDRLGFQVLLHAIGDKAIGQALDAFAFAAKANGTSRRRHRVEHVEVPRLQDLPRFKALGVIASTQPIFANPDETVLTNFEPLLGPERAPHADSFSLFDNAGIVQAFGSDYPVFYLSVIEGIAVAVTRTTADGSPAGGWHPAGRIPVEAALRHYTIDGAFATFDDKERGSLATGKLADFVVLSHDLTRIPSQSIRDTKVLLTVMGGKETYRSPGY